MKFITGFVMLLALWAAPAAAAPEIYSKQQLAGDKDRYAQRFQFLLQKGLWDFMTPEEQRALQSVVVRHPMRGNNPLTVKSFVLNGKPIVQAPVMSLKFIEDLSVAYAWRYNNNYSLEPIDEYLVMLKHRPAEEFPGGRMPDPMAALGVPPKIWERDPQVDDLALRFRNTAWAFILAHELGSTVARPRRMSTPPSSSFDCNSISPAVMIEVGPFCSTVSDVSAFVSSRFLKSTRPLSGAKAMARS